MADGRAPSAGMRHLVAPELLRWLDLFPVIELTDESLSRMRTPQPGQRGIVPPPLSPEQRMVACERRFIPGLGGAPDVRVLVYTPPGAIAARPAYLHMHGGGFVLGTPEINDGSNRDIAARHGCAVVSVDYRLAPETRVPGAVEDCSAALIWLHDQAATLGIDPARIAIGGESAGGGHAVALALRARDHGGLPICFQLLESPMLDDRTGSDDAPHPLGNPPTWTAAQNRFGWQALLGVEPGGDAVPAGAVPARETDLARLPPALITVGALDLFADEDIAFARRLIRAGVPTELHVIPGAFHGFAFGGEDAPQVAALLRYRRDALARAFAQPQS